MRPTPVDGSASSDRTREPSGAHPKADAVAAETSARGPEASANDDAEDARESHAQALGLSDRLENYGKGQFQQVGGQGNDREHDWVTARPQDGNEPTSPAPSSGPDSR